MEQRISKSLLIRFPVKTILLKLFHFFRLSASIWERAIEIINHFQKLNLDTFELATFLIIAISTSIGTNSTDTNMKSLMAPLLSRVIKTLNNYYCQNMGVEEAGLKTGNLLMFISSFVVSFFSKFWKTFCCPIQDHFNFRKWKSLWMNSSFSLVFIATNKSQNYSILMSSCYLLNPSMTNERHVPSEKNHIFTDLVAISMQLPSIRNCIEPKIYKTIVYLIHSKIDKKNSKSRHEQDKPWYRTRS